MSATPLLDREQPFPMTAAEKRKTPAEKKKRLRSRLWTAAIGVAAGVAIAQWGPDLDESQQQVLLHPSNFVHLALSGAPGALLWLATLFFALYVSILANVLGVVAFGFAWGFELRILSLGGVLLERRASGWRVRFASRRLFRAFASMTTLSTEHLTRRWAWMIRGGSTATVVLLIIALFALRKGDFFQLLFIANLFIAALCFIPYTLSGNPSPAKRLMILEQEGAAGGRLTAVLHLLAIDAQGVPPSGWPREFVQRLDVPALGTPFFGPSLGLRYAATRQGNDPEAIADAIESGLASIHKLPPDSRRWFCVKASCFQASFRKNVHLAEVWLESARKVKNTILSDEDWADLDSEALGLIALAKEDTGAAKESLARYLAYVSRQPLPLCGMFVAERARAVALLNQFHG
jgi:hypothetical protein